MSYKQLLQEIRALSPRQRRQLLHEIIDLLPHEAPVSGHSLKRFRGAAAHLRDPHVDAQAYVNQLRSEGDDRP